MKYMSHGTQQAVRIPRGAQDATRDARVEESRPDGHWAGPE